MRPRSGASGARQAGERLSEAPYALLDRGLVEGAVAEPEAFEHALTQMDSPRQR